MNNKCLNITLDGVFTNPNIPNIKSYTIYGTVPAGQGQILYFLGDEPTVIRDDGLHYEPVSATIEGYSVYKIYILGDGNEHSYKISSKFDSFLEFYPNSNNETKDGIVYYAKNTFMHIELPNITAYNHNNLTYISLISEANDKNKITGNISDFSNDPIQHFIIYQNPYISGTLSEIINKYKDSIIRIQVEATNVSCNNIELLGLCPNFSLIHLNRPVSGSLEQLVENARSIEKTSNQYTLNYMYETVTIFGHAVPTSTFFYLKFDANSISYKAGSGEWISYDNSGNPL